jgi:hypothetical protein
VSEQNQSGNYDHIRCPVCANPWISHPTETLCNRHRPVAAPAWVGEALARYELAATASNLPPSADDAEKARREVTGGVPTREWAAAVNGPADGIPPREFLSAVMARASEKNGEAHV